MVLYVLENSSIWAITSPSRLQNDWTKSNRGAKKGSKQKYRLRFRLLDLKDPDVTEAIHAALKKPGNLPFNALLHVIFEYVGKTKMGTCSSILVVNFTT